MKQCTNCKITKLYSEFYKMTRVKKDGSQGYRSYCKVCISEKTKARRKVDSERMKEVARKSYEKCKHRYKERERKYYKANKETYKNRRERYFSCPETKERYLEKGREYAKNNREKVNETSRKYKKKRRNSDPVYRMKTNIRCRIHHILKTKGYKKYQNTEDFIGGDWEVLWGHLNGTFEANYGIPREWLSSFEYEIDHIIPLSSAKTLEEVIKLNHYTNLQILTKEDNRKKSASLDWSL